MFKKLYSKLLKGESPMFGIYLLLIFGLISLLIFPYLFTRDWGLPPFNESGNIGDTINGIAAPFIAVAAAILTFLAFYVQYQANQTLRADSDNRNRDVTVERFENKYYELIKLHRENVTEINISGKLHARKAFVYMFYEFQLCYRVVEKEYSLIKVLKGNLSLLDEADLINIAYKFYFFGVGPNSNILIKDVLKKYPSDFINNCKNKLLSIQERIWKEMKRKQVSKSIEYYIFNFTCTDGELLKFEAIYYPFDGHSSKIGHYYRHLYQTIMFIDNEKKIFDTKPVNETKTTDESEVKGYKVNKKKYEYIKTLRAQLSNHEQLLLFYNVVSDFGQKWERNGTNLLIKYRLIKNIPLPLANLGVSPKEFFKNELEDWAKDNTKQNGTCPTFFEWDEIGK